MMQASETLRVREHLDGALDLLDARETHALDRAAQLTRSLLRAELALYRDRGVFPLNHDHASRRPAFIDDHGTRCAMAHLMELGGARDLVAEVARTTNHAYVEELAGDPRFLAWLESAGLTVAEAARIQPGYDMSAARCLCVVAPPEVGQAVPGVIEATITGGTPGVDSPLDARVDVVHGSAPFAVGATMKVVSSSSIGAIGDRVLVPIPKEQKEGTPYALLTTIEANGIVGAVCNPQYSNWNSGEIGYLAASEVVALRGEASQSACVATLAAKDKCYDELAARRESSNPRFCVYGNPSSSSSGGAVESPKSPGANPGDTTTPPSSSATADDTTGGCSTAAAHANPSSVAVLLAVVGVLVARQARRS